ncbi:hypothetical protein BD779DRAFT_1610433 [Infundibulicybe gibba]|nr:hypothetical protein BD779DRAFT_1610433 [Infundibulicybe gibba]
MAPGHTGSLGQLNTHGASEHATPVPPHAFDASNAQRKPRIDLRPAPIKLKSTTMSSTHTPLKPTKSLPRPESSVSANSLASIKEATKRDIQDAEEHGILTPPPPDANWFKRTMHKGIQLVKFYYRGVKLIFVRRKEISIIMARIKKGGSPLSRWESRLIRTQKDDINKVIPFLFIALLLEEIIPLIAIYAPFMLPSTCILLPSALKSAAFALTHKQLYAQLIHHADPTGHLPLESLRRVPDASAAICGLLRLSTIGVDALRIRRIRRHLEFLAEDDRLLVQDNLPGHLSERGLNEALEERGFIIQGLNTKVKESRLKWWLDSVADPITINSSTRRLFLLTARR